jgi:hypothetical protein
MLALSNEGLAPPNRPLRRSLVTNLYYTYRQVNECNRLWALKSRRD